MGDSKNNNTRSFGNYTEVNVKYVTRFVERDQSLHIYDGDNIGSCYVEVDEDYVDFVIELEGDRNIYARMTHEQWERMAAFVPLARKRAESFIPEDESMYIPGYGRTNL